MAMTSEDLKAIRANVKAQSERLNRSKPTFRKGPRHRGASRKVVRHLRNF